MATSAHVSKVRSLYKKILVLHRFLPIDLRAIGDQYVKDEFRRHKSASPTEVKGFMTEWENYKDTLQTQVLELAGERLGPVKFGAHLSEGNLKDFQNEQIGQLYELMLESTKPNTQFNIQEDNIKKWSSCGRLLVYQTPTDEEEEKEKTGRMAGSSFRPLIKTLSASDEQSNCT